VARKRDKASSAHIQELLAERKRIEQWLVRLDKAADRTPEAVRKRVKGDYESRLGAIVQELQGYQEDLRGSLQDVQARLAASRQDEKRASEELAEAELRYAVGEFGEGAWSEKKGAILDRLIGIRESLGQAEEEIGELEEVLRSIAEPVTPEKEAEEAEPEIAELEDIEEPELELPPAPAASRGTPERITLGSELGLRDLGTGKTPIPAAAKKDQKPPGGALGDELAFLKALSDDGGTTPPPPVRPPAPPVPAEPRVPSVGPARGQRVSEPPSVSRSRPSVINQRTLKCGECGAMNLPTEWYCDRCGAELASL
jgi:hypothetical protein